MRCTCCGKELSKYDKNCKYCGQSNQYYVEEETEYKDKLILANVALVCSIIGFKLTVLLLIMGFRIYDEDSIGRKRCRIALLIWSIWSIITIVLLIIGYSTGRIEW